MQLYPPPPRSEYATFRESAFSVKLNLNILSLNILSDIPHFRRGLTPSVMKSEIVPTLGKKRLLCLSCGARRDVTSSGWETSLKCPLGFPVAPSATGIFRSLTESQRAALNREVWPITVGQYMEAYDLQLVVPLHAAADQS